MSSGSESTDSCSMGLLPFWAVLVHAGWGRSRRDEHTWWRAQVDYLRPPADGNAHSADAFIGSPSLLLQTSRSVTF